MKDLMEMYPSVRCIEMIAETTFAPKVLIKFKYGDEIYFTINRYSNDDEISKQIEDEILKQIKVFRERKLKRICS